MTVTTTEAESGAWEQLRRWPRHDGPMSLDRALDLVSRVRAAYRDARGMAPLHRQSGHVLDRALAATIPDGPGPGGGPLAPSLYTCGRVRRLTTEDATVTAWAADLGHAGTSREIGVYGSEGEARAAIEAAADAAWYELEAWLHEYVVGEWTLTREPLTITRQDRVTVAQAAELAGVGASTWRAYVARGQAPAADGQTNSGAPWWLRETVETWLANRPGQGRRRGGN